MCARFTVLNAQEQRVGRTKCNLGGQRPWFLCPADDRQGNFADGAGGGGFICSGGAFGCRQCGGLVYESQQHAFIRKVLGTMTPASLAAELVDNTKLADVALRRGLVDADEVTIAATGPA